MSVRRYAVAAALLLFSLLLLAGSLQLAKRRQVYAGQVTYAAQEAAYDAGFLRSVVEPQHDHGNSGKSGADAGESGINDVSDISLTAWSEKRDEAVYDEESRRQNRADVMLVYGSSGNLLPYGAQLYPEDKEGCLVSRDVAERLFGTGDAVGHTLRYGDHTWVVRGIIKEPKELVMLEVSGMLSEVSLDRLTVRLSGDTSPTVAGRQLVNARNISGTQIRLDYYENWQFLTELIPGKWSDFEGWAENWKTMQENREQLSQLKKGALERHFISLSRQGRAAGIAGGILLAVTLLVFLRVTPDKKAPGRAGNAKVTSGRLALWRFRRGSVGESRHARLRSLRHDPAGEPHPASGLPWRGARRPGFFRRFRDSDK